PAPHPPPRRRPAAGGAAIAARRAARRGSIRFHSFRSRRSSRSWPLLPAQDIHRAEDGDDDALHRRDEIVEGRIVTAVLDHMAGMADRRAVTPEGEPDIGLRDPQRHMADIHGYLAGMAGDTAAVAARQQTIS